MAHAAQSPLMETGGTLDLEWLEDESSKTNADCSEASTPNLGWSTRSTPARFQFGSEPPDLLDPDPPRAPPAQSFGDSIAEEKASTSLKTPDTDAGEIASELYSRGVLALSTAAIERERRRSLVHRRSMNVSRASRTRQLKQSLFGKPENHEEPSLDVDPEQHDERLEHMADDKNKAFVVTDVDSRDRKLVPIHPDSFASSLWDLVMLLSIVFTIIVDPISIAFAAIEEADWFLVTDRLITAIYILDIVKHFVSGYHVEINNLAEMRWRAVAMHYVRGWFWLDLIAALPQEVFSVSQLSSLKSARLGLIGMHAMKYAKLGEFARRLHVHVDLQISPFTVHIGLWASLILTWIHFTSCISCWLWVKVGNQDQMLLDFDGQNWGSDFAFDEEQCEVSSNKSGCLSRYYLRSFRSSIGYLVGHGQFSGDTWSEEIMIVICSFSGKALYQSFMSYCIHLMMKISKHRTVHYSKSQTLDRFLAMNEVDLDMRFRARKHMELAWERYGSHNEESCMMLLPQRLQSQIHLSKLEPMLKSVPFLHSVSKEFVVRVAAVVKGEAFVIGDYLMQAGELSSEMFFIEEGVVQVETMQHEPLALLGEGAYAGENALFGPVVRSTNIYGFSVGTVLTLCSSDFFEVLQRFPAVERTLRDNPMFTGRPSRVCQSDRRQARRRGPRGSIQAQPNDGPVVNLDVKSPGPVLGAHIETTKLDGTVVDLDVMSPGPVVRPPMTSAWSTASAALSIASRRVADEMRNRELQEDSGQREQPRQVGPSTEASSRRHPKTQSGGAAETTRGYSDLNHQDDGAGAWERGIDLLQNKLGFLSSEFAGEDQDRRRPRGLSWASSLDRVQEEHHDLALEKDKSARARCEEKLD